MPTITISPACEPKLQDVADFLARSRKIVVITGAGISTNCGIPVSKTYALVKSLRTDFFYRTFAQKTDFTHLYKPSMMQPQQQRPLPSQTILMIDLKNDANLIDHALWDPCKLLQNYRLIDNFGHRSHSIFQPQTRELRPTPAERQLFLPATKLMEKRSQMLRPRLQWIMIHHFLPRRLPYTRHRETVCQI